jgi:hypothetical protein
LAAEHVRELITGPVKTRNSLLKKSSLKNIVNGAEKSPSIKR